MGESVTEGVIAQWLKAEGEAVAADEGLTPVAPASPVEGFEGFDQ